MSEKVSIGWGGRSIPEEFGLLCESQSCAAIALDHWSFDPRPRFEWLWRRFTSSHYEIGSQISTASQPMPGKYSKFSFLNQGLTFHPRRTSLQTHQTPETLCVASSVCVGIRRPMSFGCSSNRTRGDSEAQPILLNKPTATTLKRVATTIVLWATGNLCDYGQLQRASPLVPLSLTISLAVMQIQVSLRPSALL